MASLTLSSSFTKPNSTPFLPPNPSTSPSSTTVSFPSKHHRAVTKSTSRLVRAVSISNPDVRTGPDDLVESLISKVTGSDRGIDLTSEQHREVASVAEELKKYCVSEPVKCPLIFGDWDVEYCSIPTSPGGGYRSGVGRAVFKTKEMIQVVQAPDIVNNKVSFSVFGFLDGQVTLKGKLKVCDSEWIQVIFEPPEFKVGPFEIRYGGESEVMLQITYIDEKIRLGKGSKGSLFVFRRRN